MNKIARQILQLKNELERQKTEQTKLLVESQNITREAQREIEWLHAQRQETKVEKTPQPSDAPATKSNTTPSTNNFYQGKVPSTEDLQRIVSEPEKFGSFFQELDDWYARDRAAQEAVQPQTANKWFGGGRTPDIGDMLDPRNFDEMLAELEKMP